MFSHNIAKLQYLYNMETFYIFSKNNYKIFFNNNQYNINDATFCKITNILPDCVIKIEDDLQSLEINLKKLQTCNFCRVHKLNNTYCVEIIGINFNNIYEKQNTKNCEIILYDNVIRLFYKGICYTHYFKKAPNSCVFEFEDKLYYCNDKNILIFDFNSCTFLISDVEKYTKNDNNLEILFKIYKNSNYFLHYSYNFNNSTLNIKKLNKENDIKDTTIFDLFYLIKFNFKQAENLLSKNINCENIKSYFLQFEKVLEFNNNYYLVNNNSLATLSFKIDNNVFVDID